MVNAAKIADILSTDAKQFGFHLSDYRFAWDELKKERDAYIARLNGIYTRNLQNSKVSLISGTGSFNSAKEITVGDKVYTADHVVIAVGGKPFLPPIPGVEHAITSDGFFKLGKTLSVILIATFQ